MNDSPESIHASARAMASLLNATAPQRLNELRQRFPGELDLFDPTYVLGGSAAPATDGFSPSRHQALRALIDTTLTTGEKSLTTIVQTLTSRIRRVRTIRLTAAVATALAGALTAAPAIGTPLPLPPLLGPGFAFAGSLGVLVGEHWEKPLAGGHSSLGELLGETLVAEAAFTDARLRLAGDDLSQDSALLDLARRVSEAAAKLRHVTVFGGVAPVRTA